MFEIIEGRQSSYYNHFEEYELASCRATASRLMGAIAVKNIWRSKEDPARRFYQVMHLDYSEYGIDEYLEFECVPGQDDYSENKEMMNAEWNTFINVMGESAVSIKSSCMLRLLDSALKLAGDDIEREYDDEENVRFRHYALRRLTMMREVLAVRGISSQGCSVYEAIDAVSARCLGQYATINYFLMRMVDRDFEAASFLSSIPAEELEHSELSSHGVQTLMRNSISKVKNRDNSRKNEKLREYSCRMTTLAPNGYYHTSLSIWLDGGWTSKDAVVVDYKVGSSTLLSDYESAIQIAKPEFITVFDINAEDLQFIPANIPGFTRANLTECTNGLLYTIYNPTNSHAEKSEYSLGDDVYGYALHSLGGELIIMSSDLVRAQLMDEAIVFSIYSPYVRVKGRFRLDNPIFHTICHTPGLRFDDLVEPDE